MELEKLRQDLIHFDRVAAMTELTASLAHELRQPLTAILSNAQAARRMLERGVNDAKDLREGDRRLPNGFKCGGQPLRRRARHRSSLTHFQKLCCTR